MTNTKPFHVYFRRTADGCYNVHLVEAAEDMVVIEDHFVSLSLDEFYHHFPHVKPVTSGYIAVDWCDMLRLGFDAKTALEAGALVGTVEDMRYDKDDIDGIFGGYESDMRIEGNRIIFDFGLRDDVSIITPAIAAWHWPDGEKSEYPAYLVHGDDGQAKAVVFCEWYKGGYNVVLNAVKELVLFDKKRLLIDMLSSCDIDVQDYILAHIKTEEDFTAEMVHRSIERLKNMTAWDLLTNLGIKTVAISDKVMEVVGL